MLHFHGRCSFVKESPIWVPECVPSDSGAQACRFCSGFDVLLLDSFLPVRLLRRGIWEHPILIPLEAALLFPVEQHSCQIIIERNKIVRVFGLDEIHTAMNRASLNEQYSVIEIEVAPLQSHNLADSEPQALSYDHHRPVRLFQVR